MFGWAFSKNFFVIHVLQELDLQNTLKVNLQAGADKHLLLLLDISENSS